MKWRNGKRRKEVQSNGNWNLFGVLALLLIVGLPVAGVFGGMALLPSVLDPQFTYGASAVVRSMFSGLDSFTLLAVPLFMVSGMIMAKGGLSEKLFNFFRLFYRE